MKKNIRSYSKNERIISSRRDKLSKCAARVFVKKGYDRTSMRDISGACNMSIGTLYRYIGSKKDLLQLVIEQGMKKEVDYCREAFQQARLMGPVEALKFAIREYLKTADDIQDILLFSYRSIYQVKPSIRKDVLNLDTSVINEFKKILDRGCEEGLFRIDDVSMVAYTIDAMTQMWAVKRWAFKGVYTLDEYIETNTNLILKSILR